jgi:CBS domain-containing protein
MTASPPDVSLGAIMSRDLVCATPDLDIAAVVGLMIQRHVGCIPVVDARGRPMGVLTKYDVVEQLEAAMRAADGGFPLPSDLTAQTADDVMMPLALTLSEHATVTDAAKLMTCEDTHHVLVVDRDRKLVGVVSSKDVVRWLADRGPWLATTRQE